MTKNPYINAVLAALYIVCIVFVMSLFVDNNQLENSGFVLLIPMTMLSLFVLSAAVMGFLFLHRPLSLYLDNKKREAVIFFGKTLGAFALCALVFLGLLLNAIN